MDAQLLRKKFISTSERYCVPAISAQVVRLGSVVGWTDGAFGVLPLQFDWNHACSAVVRTWALASTAQSVRMVLPAVGPALTVSVTIMPSAVRAPEAGDWLITVPAGTLGSAASMTR